MDLGSILNNRYTLAAKIGKGAMGTVYRAADAYTKQEVAVKILSRDLALDHDMLARFRREGEALRQLRHPNIVGYVDMFEHEDQQIIVMEYVPGGNLHDLIRQGPVPLDRTRRIALGLCDALTRAHDLGIVHRDLKPENVLLAADGTPKLTDFGVARLMEAGTKLTGTGTQVGTPFYMSPEAWQGKPLDAQADIWSLGIVLYEMLSGQVPFGGDTLIAVMNKVLNAPLPELKAVRPDLPPDMGKIVRKMLTREKPKRYQSMRQVAVDLEQCVLPAATRPPAAATAMKPEPPPTPAKPAKPAFPLWAGIAIGGVVLALICAGAAAAGLSLAAMSSQQASRSGILTQTALWASFQATQKAQSVQVSPTPLPVQTETPISSPAPLSPTPSPTAAAPTVMPTSAPSAAAPSLDSVVIALAQEPDTLHPLVGSMLAKTYVENAINVGCMSQNELAQWVPLGCESIPSVENGGAQFVGDGADRHLEVTYKIKQGWRWTDGTPVTARDVLYWWHLHMDPKFQDDNRYAPEKIYDITAVDDNTVVVKYLSQKQLNEAVAGTLTGNVDFKSFKDDYVSNYGAPWPNPAFDFEYWANIGWLPAHILEGIPGDKQAQSDYARKPVGDGPYVVSDWKAGQEIVLTKSDKPFPLGDPKIKTITFRFFADGAGVLAALQSGEVDAAMGNTAGLTEANGQDLDALEKAGQFKVDWIPGYVFEHIDLNTTKPPLDDVKVRQALYLAIDRQQLSDTLYNGKRIVTDVPLPKGLSWGYPPDSDLTHYPYDPAKAAQLLKDDGWDCSAKPCTKQDASGKTIQLKFTLTTTDRADRQQLALMIQAMWNKINAGTNVESLQGRGLFAACASSGPLTCRTFDAAIYAWAMDDTASFYSEYACNQIPNKQNNMSGNNYPGWCNKAADDALNQSENNPDNAVSPVKRLPFLTTFFQQLTSDVPAIYLYDSAEPFAHRVNWKNFKAGPTQYSSPTWNTWEWDVSK